MFLASVLCEVELEGAKDSVAPELFVSSVTRSRVPLTCVRAVEVRTFMFFGLVFGFHLFPFSPSATSSPQLPELKLMSELIPS